MGERTVVLVDGRRTTPVKTPMTADEADERRTRRIALASAAAFAVVLVGFWAWWPAGVVLGLVLGIVVVLRVGRAMAAGQTADAAGDLQALTGEEELQEEFHHLRDRLGDDWPAFRSAAQLVTQAQWASVAGLQRELRISTGSAQHLMGQLEREGFVGPSRGARPRVVRLGRDRAEDLDRMMAF